VSDNKPKTRKPENWVKEDGVWRRKALSTAAQRKRYRNSWKSSDDKRPRVLPEKTQKDHDKEVDDYRGFLGGQYTDKEKRSMKKYWDKNNTTKGWRYSDPDKED